ncbi:hypothetical protein [Flavivirga eckloniae]|uniref:Cell wall anchor protein n=1 Tax=Flavivirga eckloniae TaxID=1803846 RepID=A0A2K9PKI5_9FLAO|nr:hypothetical protein [Flavivirga eckloniae]AUP77564.1 hypothetical protein C1H87_02045 [Flavivirga eckloniae]
MKALFFLSLTLFAANGIQAQWTENGTSIETQKNLKITNPEGRFFSIDNNSSSIEPVKFYLSGNNYTRGLQLGRDDENHSIFIKGELKAYKEIKAYNDIRAFKNMMFTNPEDRHFSIENSNSATEPVKFYLSGYNYDRGLQLGRDDGNHKIILNGKVGIGTSNPSGWKLAVNGQIRAKEIKVETGWSDFVFYDDYKLPTLQDVENHIKEKGHLRDIPSAKEVQENGIFLGEMDSKLLQKIEELTLYTISQEKKLKSQDLKIERLEKENESLKLLAVEFLELQKRLEKLEKSR